LSYTDLQFRDELRLLLSDTAAIKTFTDAQVDTFKNMAVRKLYSYDLANEVTNYDGTKGSMPLATIQDTDYSMSTWRRVSKIEYWTNETTPQYIADSRSWDDRVRSGYVTIYDAPSFFNQRIKMIGLTEYTGVTDPTLTSDIYEVILYQAALYALDNFAMHRTSSRRSAAGIRGSDAYALRFISSFRREWMQDLKKSIVSARSATRPIG